LHLLSLGQDFMHVLSPTGNVMFSTPSIRDLTGWTSDEVTGRPIADFIHTDDVAGFLRDFESSLRDGHDLTLYYRFRMKDDRYTIFEITGHPYYAEENGQQQCKCFFAMGRPYPSKNTAMLDSFLELKTENERLRQELQVMYGEMEGTGPAIDYRPGASGSNNDYSTHLLAATIRQATDAGSSGQARQSSAAYTGFETSQSPYDQSHANLSPGPDMGGPSQAKAPMVSSMANYGASHSGPSAASVKAETAAEKKKKVSSSSHSSRSFH
jgi:PAS domain S-box-containing protein